MNNYNILITGGAGYLGSIMVPELLAQGHRVTVLDNFMFNQLPFGQVCHDPAFDVIRGDARDTDALRPLVKNADIVIPLAALVGAKMCDSDQVGTVSTNRDAVQTLVGMLSKNQRIMMPVTNSGYGIGDKDVFCTEESPLRPISLYGRTKVEAEAIALEHGETISYRLATVFGMAPRMRIDLLVNDFVHRALTDRVIVLFESHFKRNYIHVRDVARAFLLGIEKFEDMKGGPYNVGLSDANLSKRELCDLIGKHIPELVILESEFSEDPDKRDYIVSNEKIERAGFSPKFSLDDGVTELKKGYQMLRNTIYGNA